MSKGTANSNNTPNSNSKPAISDAMRAMLGLPLPSTTTRGGVLSIAADVSRLDSISVNGVSLHPEAGTKIHPRLASIYKILAVVLVTNPRSDRGSAMINWVAKHSDTLELVGDRTIRVTSQGTEVEGKVADILEYCKSNTKIAVKFGTVLRVRKEKEESTEEYEFI